MAIFRNSSFFRISVLILALVMSAACTAIIEEADVDLTQEVSEEATAEATDPASDVTPEPESDETPEAEATDEAGNIIPIIVIEGPVEEVSINYITIFGTNIQVDPADPILTQIRIGDTIRIKGHSSFEGGTIIIVALNIIIVETTIIVVNNPSYVFVGIPTNCRVKKSGKITCKKHSRRS